MVFRLPLETLLAEKTCESDENYVKVRMQAGQFHANEEKYSIWNGGSEVVTSPVLANNELRVTEYCIPQSSTSTYTLKLIDS